MTLGVGLGCSVEEESCDTGGGWSVEGGNMMLGWGWDWYRVQCASRGRSVCDRERERSWTNAF